MAPRIEDLLIKATIQAVTLSALSNVTAQLISCYQDERPWGIDIVHLARFLTFAFLNTPPNVLWQSWLENTYPGYTSPEESGTADSIAKHPSVQDAREKAAPVVQSINEKTSAATTAITENETIKGITRRATEGVDKVKSNAAEIIARTSDLVRNQTTKMGSPKRAMTFSTPDGQVLEKPAGSGSDNQLQDDVGVKSDNQKKLNIKNTAIKFGLDQTIGALVNTVVFIAGMAALRGQGLEQMWIEIQRDTLPLIFAGQKLWPLVSLISFTLVPLEYRTLFGSIIGVGWGIFLSLFTGNKS